jgi:hypothetical protein
MSLCFLRIAALCLGLSAISCSLRYDPDELPNGQTDGAVVIDASDGDDIPDASASPDGAEPVPDAAPLPDAAQNPGDCGDIGEMCCVTDPICGFGDEFIECNLENDMCEACGHLGQACCRTGPECDGGLGCVELLGIETCVSL